MEINTIMNEKEIQLRSDEVREILSKVPPWIIRWGITTISIIIAVLIVCSIIFTYPDIVYSKVTLTTENPPSDLVARASGRISDLMVTDKQKVKKGTVILIIENPANYDDIKKLKIRLKSFQRLLSFPDTMLTFNFPSHYKLGELQLVYTKFVKQYRNYVQFVDLNYHKKKINALNNEIEEHRHYITQLMRQSQLIKSELRISERQYNRDSLLHQQKTYSDVDFEQSKSTFLKKQYNYQQTLTEITNSRINVKELKQRILDLQLDYIETKQTLETDLNQSLSNLNSAIATWEKKYVLQSPVDGTVTFTNYWNKNQNVSQGETVLTVIPAQPSKLVGKLSLPIAGSGKVKSGQTVNIKLVSYPYMEYGMLRGKIQSISLVPKDNNYMVEVNFPDSLKTTYGKTLEFSQEMKGVAEIITEKQSVFLRFVNPIKSLLKNRAE